MKGEKMSFTVYQIYDSYVEFCRKLRIEPLPFERWMVGY